MEPSWTKGCTPGGGVWIGPFLGFRGWVKLSKAEEPLDRHWTVEVVG